MVRVFCETEGIEWVIVRPPLIYGRGVAGNFARIIDVLLKNIPLPVLGLHNKRSMVSVENFSDFLIECVVNEKSVNELFLVSDDQDLSVSRLVYLLKVGFRSESFLFSVGRLFFLWTLSVFGKRKVAKRLCDELTVDITKAKTLLNWKPPLTAEQALNKMRENNE